MSMDGPAALFSASSVSQRQRFKRSPAAALTSSNFKQRLVNAQEQETSSDRIAMDYLEIAEEMSDGSIYRPLSDLNYRDVFEQGTLSRMARKFRLNRADYEVLTKVYWEDHCHTVWEGTHDYLTELIELTDTPAETEDDTPAPAPAPKGPRRSVRFAWDKAKTSQAPKPAPAPTPNASTDPQVSPVLTPPCNTDLMFQPITTIDISQKRITL